MHVRVEAPSSPFPPPRLAAGVDFLRGRGHDVDDTKAGPRGTHAYLNGDDAERAASLNAALASKADVVWLARGGYGLTRILDAIAASKHHPIVAGSSDVTALFARLAPAGTRCVHGPLLTQIADEPPESVEHMLAILEGRARDRVIRVAESAQPLDVIAPIFAGNLAVLCALLGTRHCPTLAGHIVVLEEIGERPYRIDRLLTQLVQSGALDGVAAIISGHLAGCDEAAGKGTLGRAEAPSPREVFRERLAHLPLAHGIAVGHQAPSYALPIGLRARLSCSPSGGTLTLLEDFA